MGMTVKLQVLLRKEWRTSEGLATVRPLATALGMKPTAAGTATMSLEMESEAFEALFGQPAVALAARPPRAPDFGSPGGATASPLVVPKTLRDFVLSISVAPPHTRMGDPGEEPSK